MSVFSPTIEVETATGAYSVIKSTAGCDAFDTAVVTVIPAPVPPMIADSVMCDGAPIMVDAGNPFFSKLWSNMKTAQVVSIDAPGTYWVSIANNTPCIIFDTFTVGTKQGPSGFRAADTMYCHGASVMINAKPGYLRYKWSTGDTTETLWVDSPGTYALTVFDGSCQGTENTVISKTPSPSTVLITDSVFCGQDNEHISIPLPKHYTYTLLPAQTVTDSLVLNIAGIYKLHIEDTLGCTNEQQFNIEEYCAPVLFSPDAFTPNGDGINDIFNPLPTFKNWITSYKLEVYNRWGQLVFISTSADKGWDGTHDAISATPDTYVYHVEVVWDGVTESTKKQMMGTVTLLR
jgi:gliding motility-associated-like protein